ncbi:hypothetical protein THAOC_21386, partial [Thalassiosira oceanica]
HRKKTGRQGPDTRAGGRQPQTNAADRGTEDQGFARNKKRRLVQVRRQDAFKPDETAGGSSALLLLASTKRRGAAAHVDAAPDRRACLQPVDQGRGQRAGHDEHPHLRHAGVRPARQDVGRVALQGHGVPRELRQGEERHPAAPRPGPPRRRRRAGPAAGGDVRRGRGQEGGVRGDGLPVAASPGLRGRRRRRMAGRPPVVRLPSEA